MHCCKRVWKLPHTRLRRSSSIVATLSTVACLNSWIVMIRHWNTRSFRNPPQEKVRYSKVGRPSRPSDVAEQRDNSSEHFTNNSHTVSYHMKWRPLLYRSSCRQPRQAIAPAQYSNSKCVSRLRATLYNNGIRHNLLWIVAAEMAFLSSALKRLWPKKYLYIYIYIYVYIYIYRT